jgi:hypothetical protein
LLGALAAGQRGPVVDDMADEVKSIEVPAYLGAQLV